MSEQSRKGWVVRGLQVGGILVGVLVVAAAGAYLGLTLAGPHKYGLGAYLRDFGKSSGFAGVAALGAASLTFFGLSRQLRVSRANLDHEKERAQASSWWQSFEWASSRGIPADPKEIPLPVDVSIGTMNSLQTQASNGVQEAACAGLLELLAKRLAEQAEPAPEVREPLDEPGQARGLEALQRYVEATATRPAARSAYAEALVFESEVLNYLRQLEQFGVSVATGVDATRRVGSRRTRADAVVGLGGRECLLEVKAWSQPPSRQMLERLRDQTESLSREFGLPVLVVTQFNLGGRADVEWRSYVEFLDWSTLNGNTRALLASLSAATTKVILGDQSARD